MPTATSCRTGGRAATCGVTSVGGAGDDLRGLAVPGRAGRPPEHRQESTSLADILERVLDKGIVIAGDIRVNLLDIELLTIKIRLLVASVDKAREMGIDWWEHDPTLSSRRARRSPRRTGCCASASARWRLRHGAADQASRERSKPARAGEATDG